MLFVIFSLGLTYEILNNLEMKVKTHSCGCLVGRRAEMGLCTLFRFWSWFLTFLYCLNSLLTILKSEGEKGVKRESTNRIFLNNVEGIAQ